MICLKIIFDMNLYKHNIFTMQSEITLQLALEKAYPRCYRRVKDLSSAWYLFTPYQNKKTCEISYFKLVELPSSFRTSEEIYSKVLQRYNKCNTQILHQVEIIFIERCFQVSFYLLKSSCNVISLRGFLELREDCGEKVESTVITRLIQFIAHLEGRVFSQQGKNYQKELISSFCDKKSSKTGNIASQSRLNQMNLDVDSIGMTKNGNFKVCDYSLYFLSIQDHTNHNMPYLKLSRNSSSEYSSNNLTFDIQNQEIGFAVEQNLLQSAKKQENLQKSANSAAKTSIQKKRNKQQNFTFSKSSSQTSLSKPGYNILRNSLRKIITRLTTLNKKFDLSNEQLYVVLIQNYSLHTANIISRVLALEEFKKEQILQILCEQRKKKPVNNLLTMKSMLGAADSSEIEDGSITVTDSFIESIDLNDGIEVIHGSFINSESGQATSKIKDSSSGSSNINVRSTISSMIDSLKSKPKIKKSLQFVLVLLIISLIAGGIFLTIREANKIIACEQGEFKTEKGVCLACSFGCSQCQNEQANACSLCRGTWFLVIRSYTDKFGTCMENCDGRPFIDKNICIVGQQ